MNKRILTINIFLYFFIFFFSFSVNYFYANLGVFPIDTFAFFDTAYNILLERHPFRDIWTTTGPVVDYMQAFAFKFFGLNWWSYVAHASIINSIVSIFFYETLLRFKLNKYLSLFYSLSFSILGYTVSGTPFAYLHSYMFSILAILIFFHCIKFKSRTAFFFLPVTIFFAFFSMQNPATFIGVNVLFFLGIFFYYNFQLRLIISLISGLLLVLIIFFIYLITTRVPVENIWQQYFLFPLSIGENRIVGNEMAHITLSGTSTLKNIFGHFKFINFFILIFFLLTILEVLKKKLLKEDFIINFSLIFLGISLIFNQLITSNQTYIFSIIPFLGAFFHIFFKDRYPQFIKTQFFIACLILFCVCKYHAEYNIKRKFMDLQNVNLDNHIDAGFIDKKFNNLKWITVKFKENHKEELNLIKEAANYIKKEKKSKMLLTDYQFFSFLLEENLNIPNRWYTHDNNSYPLKGHKYFDFYKKHINKIIDSREVKVVFTIGDPKFENFQFYFDNLCFTRNKINKIMNSYNLKKCN